MDPRSRTLKIVTLVLGVLIIGSLVLSMVGCSSEGSGTVSEFENDEAPDRSAVIGAIADDVIVPAQRDLADATAELAASTAALCDTPDNQRLSAAREAWDGAEGAWRRTEAFRFGPAKDLRSGADISYEIDADKLEADLSEPGKLPEEIEVAVVAELGADVRGLGVVEQLLFTPADAASLEPRRCAYAAAASQLVADGAAELLTAWTDGVDGDAPFVEQFQNPGEDSMYADETEVIADLVNSSIAALTTTADMYLGPASGADGTDPEPAVVDAAPAHRALDDVDDMLASVRSIYGAADGDSASGLAVLVAEQSLSTERRMSADLADAAGAVAEVPPPMFDLDPADAAQQGAFDALTEAYDNTVAARITLRTEIASQLGVTVAFSDSDGDG